MTPTFMAVATPGLRPPQSVRVGDETPRLVAASSDAEMLAAVVEEVRRRAAETTDGSVGVIAPDGLIGDVGEALAAAGVEHGSATLSGLDTGVTLVPVSVAKGLELDTVVVVEPARIVEGQPHGLRALYVALTRATQRLSVVHTGDLPAAMLIS